MDRRPVDAQGDLPQRVGAPTAGRRRPLSAQFGVDAAIRREIVRRLTYRDTPAAEAPEFHKDHPDLDAIVGAGGAASRAMAQRLLDGAAALVDEERAARAAVERELARIHDEARQAKETLAQKADEDGLPVDTQAAIEDAISACGRPGHAAARKRLGDRLYDAIAGLGHGCSWAWLCQQPALSLPSIAQRLDARLGRHHAPSTRPERPGGGTHFRKQRRAPKVAVAKDLLPEMLLGLVRGAKVFIPIDELVDYRLTAGDWNFVVGQVLKKMEMGLVARPAFASYLLQAVRGHEERNRIPQPAPQAPLTAAEPSPNRRYSVPSRKRGETR